MILIVDDNPDVRLVLLRLFELEGYVAEGCSDGPSALEYILAHRPHCVVLDMSMPHMNGLEVLRTIRGDARYGQPKIIMFSAHDGELKDAAMAAGADGYVIKGTLDWFRMVDMVAKYCPSSGTTLPPRNDSPGREVG